VLNPLLFAPITLDVTTPDKRTVTFDVVHSVGSVISPAAAQLATTVRAVRCLIARSSDRTQNSIPVFGFAKVRRVVGVDETQGRRSTVVRIPLSSSPSARKSRELCFASV